ncbi:hypothetical protein D3C78_1288870 [compost metagenome]
MRRVGFRLRNRIALSFLLSELGSRSIKIESQLLLAQRTARLRIPFDHALHSGQGTPNTRAGLGFGANIVIAAISGRLTGEQMAERNHLPRSSPAELLANIVCC